jgi:hypothetical protein
MKYDQYGRPIPPQHGYGSHPNNSPVGPSGLSAKLDMPNMGQLGGQTQVPWVRFPFYPTSPFYSTNPNVGTQVRFYGATLLGTDNDFTVGVEAIRTVQFDIPCRLIAIQGQCVDQTTQVAAATPTPAGGLDTFLFRIEYTTGDRLMTAARLASTCLGDGLGNPGELGSTGYTIDQGGSLILGITPLASLGGLGAGGANVRIDITLVCLEIRGQRNFVAG